MTCSCIIQYESGQREVHRAPCKTCARARAAIVIVIVGAGSGRGGGRLRQKAGDSGRRAGCTARTQTETQTETRTETRTRTRRRPGTREKLLQLVLLHRTLTARVGGHCGRRAKHARASGRAQSEERCGWLRGGERCRAVRVRSDEMGGTGHRTGSGSCADWRQETRDGNKTERRRRREVGRAGDES